MEDEQAQHEVKETKDVADELCLKLYANGVDKLVDELTRRAVRERREHFYHTDFQDAR